MTNKSKWQKEVLLTKEFKSNLARILDTEFYRPRLGMITKNVPEFIENLKNAKHTIETYYKFLHETFADWYLKD